MPTDIKIIISRQPDPSKEGCPGVLTIYRGDEERLSLPTLERDFIGNKRDISSIPLGEYRLHKRTVGDFAGRAKRKFGHPYALWIKPVEGRDFILVHWGNYLSATRGCVLVGMTTDTAAGQHVVWQSKRAYRKLFAAVSPYLDHSDEGIPLTIEDGTDEEEHDLTDGDRGNL